MREFGLIGQKLSHSFSKNYFGNKFKKLKINDASYSLFELKSIEDIQQLIVDHPELCGLNVTIPYKQSVIPFLTEIDPFADEIGAVNTLKITENEIKGFNTDYYGFLTSLEKWLNNTVIDQALVLGSGGASKAVAVALSNLNIDYLVVSRHKKASTIAYEELNSEVISNSALIINTTPLGMHPEVSTYPDIPYQYLSEHHFLYDLVYNPEMTAFMRKGSEKNAQVKNGLEMLKLQAEKAWDIWNT